ncbi:unnamed protein product [Mycena citricolor]|uniref:endo-polygalacturonase n=1 Tax=Mycena citricolor TaxID=2018698 RepID=A0AAD2K1C5_9AGAR|nr:unnamed protein product [Mycena citricolor]
MLTLTTFVRLATLVAVAAAAPSNFTRTETAKRSTCTVNSVSSASNLKSCSNVVIEGFTVPSGSTLNIEAASGATVTMTGDIVFAKTSCESCSEISYRMGDDACQPLVLSSHSTPTISISTAETIILMQGNGAAYWDGKGTNGGSTKPHPFVKFKGSGTFSFVTVLNSPAQAISVGTTGASIIERVTVDNCAHTPDQAVCVETDGRYAAAGASLGHNTDGFDVSASDLTISQCTVINQDDCVAVNKGDNILVEDTTCTGSHGISIGSIASGHSVTNFKAARNKITGGLYGLRIKVDKSAKNAKVSGVTYEANTISGISDYGVLITQSYPANDGSPGSGGPISDVAFIGGTTTVAVDSSAMSVVVDCGACSGNWDFSGLDVTSGGKGHSISANNAHISGGSY